MDDGNIDFFLIFPRIGIFFFFRDILLNFISKRGKLFSIWRDKRGKREKEKISVTARGVQIFIKLSLKIRPDCFLWKRWEKLFKKFCGKFEIFINRK